MLGLLLIILPSVFSCADFWVSECDLGPDEVILQLSLPSEEGAQKICQDLCNVQFDCTYWQFSGPQLTCSLLRYSYLSRCQSMSSGPSPDISECLSQDSGTCDDFVDEDCEVNSNVLYQSDSVVDASACQEFLRLLGPVYGADVFLFSDTEGVCYLLDSPARSCVSMSGPRSPTWEECHHTTSTT